MIRVHPFYPLNPRSIAWHTDAGTHPRPEGHGRARLGQAEQARPAEAL